MREREKERERDYFIIKSPSNTYYLPQIFLSPSNIVILPWKGGESQKCEAKNNTPQILLLVLGFVFINHQD